jgi:hypothetical protein
MLDGHFFLKSKYGELKGHVRPKFLNIGLKLWLSIADKVVKESSQKSKETMVKWLLRPNFLQVFVRALYSPKNALHNVAIEVREVLLNLVTNCDLKPEFCLELISTLFGPNPMQKLAMRRNQDLLKVLADKLTSQ